MDLQELKSIMAASLLAGEISSGPRGKRLYEVSDFDIDQAVRLSQMLWEEVLKQEREG